MIHRLCAIWMKECLVALFCFCFFVCFLHSYGPYGCFDLFLSSHALMWFEKFFCAKEMEKKKCHQILRLKIYDGCVFYQSVSANAWG